MNTKWLGVVSGVMLLLAIPTWPYAYYIFLRWFIAASSIIVAYGFYKSELKGLTLVFGAIALLFNPIIPFYMSKSTWIPIDFVSAILFLVTAYVPKNEKNIQ